MEKATFGGGCFWCVEAAFKQLKGISEVESGYAGGDVDDPSYRQVCSGTTNHAEVVQMEYDPDIIEYQNLLQVFFTIHNPTQKNRQGPDVGPQYRSIILFHNQKQKSLADKYIDQLNSSDEYSSSIVTEVEEIDEFYPAEEHHQNYYEKNPNQAYCKRLIPPKLEKLSEKYDELLD